MSTQLHRSFRKVLQVQNSTTTYNGNEVPCKIVLWCIPETVTSRTVKTNHIGVSVYLARSVKNSGVSAWFSRKSVSLNLKNPLASKFFETANIKSVTHEAGNKALNRYILNTPSLSVGVTGVVQWWSGDTGYIRVGTEGYRVYACNIVGAKTWFPETACMYLVQGETVTVDLRDMGDHLTCRVTSSGHFDADKWNSLDQSKLAFKCDEVGQALNGLFA